MVSYKFYRFCRILFLVILKKKIIRNGFLQICRFYRIQYGKIQMTTCQELCGACVAQVRVFLCTRDFTKGNLQYYSIHTFCLRYSFQIWITTVTTDMYAKVNHSVSFIEASQYSIVYTVANHPSTIICQQKLADTHFHLSPARSCSTSLRIYRRLLVRRFHSFKIRCK